MRYFFWMILLISGPAGAAKLEDVTVLNINPGKNDDSVKLKLRAAKGPKDSFFYVDIVKNDAEAVAKIALAIKKMKNKNEMRLTLEIPSFSMSPSGSYYRSEDVTFSSPKRAGK